MGAVILVLACALFYGLALVVAGSLWTRPGDVPPINGTFVLLMMASAAAAGATAAWHARPRAGVLVAVLRGMAPVVGGFLAAAVTGLLAHAGVAHRLPPETLLLAAALLASLPFTLSAGALAGVLAGWAKRPTPVGA